MSESPSNEPSTEEDSEPVDVPLTDPDAVAEADEDQADGDGSNLAPDDPNRTW